MAVETTVADSSETVVPDCDPVEGSSSNSDSYSSEQASPDSSIMDEQIQTMPHDQQEMTMQPLQRRQNSGIRLIRPELLMKKEHVLNGATSAPRIDVIVNPHQFQPEFRPMVQQQRRPIKRFPQSSNNPSAVVSSSTSPGPSSRTPPPARSSNNAIVMGPPPPPALLSPPPAAVAKSPPSGQQRIRKSTAGVHRRHLSSHPDYAEEPSSSIPEIGKSREQ